MRAGIALAGLLCALGAFAPAPAAAQELPAPVATPYRFVVEFATGTGFVAPAEMSKYFLGAWECTSNAKQHIVDVFRLSSDGDTMVLIQSLYSGDVVVGSLAQNYGARNGRIGVSEQNGARLYRATSAGWNSDRIVFSGPLTLEEAPGGSMPQRMSHTRFDAQHFERRVETSPKSDGAWRLTSRENCVKG